VIVCPNCGTSNPAGSRFCANFGTALTIVSPEPSTVLPSAEPTTAPRSSPAEPPIIRAGSDPSGVPPTAPEWRMSDAGPLPKPRGRRRWLWITVGILGACLVLCLLGVVWANTIGKDVITDLSTRVAVQATSKPSP